MPDLKEFVAALSRAVITINVPLFLEVRDFMFFRREKHIISHFANYVFFPTKQT
jgi:hypothetical protein